MISMLMYLITIVTDYVLALGTICRIFEHMLCTFCCIHFWSLPRVLWSNATLQCRPCSCQFILHCCGALPVKSWIETTNDCGMGMLRVKAKPELK